MWQSFFKKFFLEVQHNDLMFVYIVKWLNKSSSHLSQYIVKNIFSLWWELLRPSFLTTFRMQYSTINSSYHGRYYIPKVLYLESISLRYSLHAVKFPCFKCFNKCVYTCNYHHNQNFLCVYIQICVCVYIYIYIILHCNSVII